MRFGEIRSSKRRLKYNKRLYCERDGHLFPYHVDKKGEMHVNQENGCSCCENVPECVLDCCKYFDNDAFAADGLEGSVGHVSTRADVTLPSDPSMQRKFNKGADKNEYR